MNYVQVFGGIGIPVLFALIFYVMYLVFSYMAHYDAGDYQIARKTRRRINWTVTVMVVLMIALITPTFIWPR